MGGQFKNVAVIGCLKTFLFIFNIVLWLSGLLLLGAGLWAEFDLYKYWNMDSAPEFSVMAPLVVICIATCTLIMSSIAFTCIVKGQPVLLFLYGAYLTLISVLDMGLGAAVVCHRDSFAKALRDGMNYSFVSHKDKSYIELLQSKLHCCGVDKYSDWLKLSPHEMIPTSCCQDPINCVTANYGDLYQRGCYEVVLEYFGNHLEVLMAIAVGVAALPLMVSCLSCFLAAYIKKVRREEVAE